jgi:hypothetical protein
MKPHSVSATEKRISYPLALDAKDAKLFFAGYFGRTTIELE